MTAKILIVDGNPLIRFGLRKLLEHEQDIILCEDAANSNDALEQIERFKPDLMIVDIEIETSWGIDFIRYVKDEYSQIRIIVFSFLDETIYAERVLRAKANGFLSKNENCEKILLGIRSVLHGGLCLSSSVQKQIVDKLSYENKRESPIDSLSNRELQILELLSKGLKPSQVAESLHLSSKTVENYRTNLRFKLKLNSAAELYHYAIEWKKSLRAEEMASIN
ncbi:MAG: response regulator transcription factor [Candidatus Omnitrophica bacterium]|nr:response regulator transcription factor [Candidatus Omnitrophota bacterium]